MQQAYNEILLQAVFSAVQERCKIASQQALQHFALRISWTLQSVSENTVMMQE